MRSRATPVDWPQARPPAVATVAPHAEDGTERYTQRYTITLRRAYCISRCDSLPLPPPPGLIALLNALELVENGLEPSVQQVMTIPGLTPTMLPPRVRVMTYFRMSAQASTETLRHVTVAEERLTDPEVVTVALQLSPHALSMCVSTGTP